MSERRRLPNRRQSETFTFVCPGDRLTYTATVSQFADGRVGELFISNHKTGSHADHAARIGYVAQQAMDGREPVSGPVRVAIEIHAAVPSSWSRRRRADALAGRLLPTTKPDLDNQIKLLLDGLAGIVFGNDKQVVEITAGKSYAVAARTVVVVEPLDGSPP